MLLYYTEQTPKEYEPPGFMPSVFEVSNLFHGDTIIQTFGSAESPHHSISLGMERVKLIEQGSSCDGSAPANVENDTLPTQPTCPSDPEIMSCIEPPKEQSVEATDITNCLCGCHINDLDMIQCDCCSNWQHTVCAGFYSNRDNRINSVNYVCFACRYANNKPVLKVMKDLSAYRRTLSVVFNEGLSEEKKMAARLGYTGRSTKRQIQKMVEDQFITRLPGKTANYSVIKTKEVRDRLRQYFNYELIKFPSFTQSGESMTQPKISKPTMIGKRQNGDNYKSSVTELTLSVNDAME